MSENKSEPVQKQSWKEKVKQFYSKHYKVMAIIPLIIGIIAFGLILMQYFQTGDFMNRGISLKGGTTLSVVVGSQQVDVNELSSALSDRFPGDEFTIRLLSTSGSSHSISIETSLAGSSAEQIIPIIEETLNIKLTENDYSIETMGSSLSESFFKELITILLIAFALMAVVVFIYFKSIMPSFYVVLCAILDLIITLAITNLFGIKISTGGIAAFLMLIDFSIDTDTLLTAKILKRDPGTSALDGLMLAFDTGLTMTATVLVAMLVSYLLSTSPDIKQIMLILLIGLVVDLFVTWMQNASLCLWYDEKSQRKAAK